MAEKEHRCTSRYCTHTPAFERLSRIVFAECDRQQEEEPAPLEATAVVDIMSHLVEEATGKDVEAVKWAIVRMK